MMLRIFRRPDNRITQNTREDNAIDAAPFAPSSDARVCLHEGGAVFLNVRTGVLFTCNPVGAEIWKGLAAQQRVGEIASAIARQFDAPREQVEQDAASFIAELEKRQFVFRAEAE